MRVLGGRSGAVSLSDFIDLVHRHAYLPFSIHRTAVGGHAAWMPKDALTIMFGDYEAGSYYTLRTESVPEFNTSAHQKGMSDGDTKLGWKSLLSQMLQNRHIRPSRELREFMGEHLWSLNMRRLSG